VCRQRIELTRTTECTIAVLDLNSVNFPWRHRLSPFSNHVLMIDPNYGIKLIKLVDVSANPIRSTTQSKKSEFMGNRVSSNIAREFNLLSLRDPYTQDRIR